MKNLIFTALVGLAMVGFTGCTNSADATPKCQTGKCDSGKKDAKKCGNTKKCDGSKKCSAAGKCGSGY